MQVERIIIQWLEVDVMHDLAWECAGDLPMLPLAARTFAAITKSSGCPDRQIVRPRCSLNTWGGCGHRGGDVGNRRNHHIAPSAVHAGRRSSHLLLVGVKRIAMPLQHLVVAITQSTRGYGALAVQACPPNNTTAPSVFGRSVSLNALVVHQTIPVRRMTAGATFNAALSIKSGRRQSNSPDSVSDHIIRYLAVPCMRWIGERIDHVECLIKAMRSLAGERAA